MIHAPEHDPRFTQLQEQNPASMITPQKLVELTDFAKGSSADDIKDPFAK